ncbi:MAG: exonuclease domain-containing protein [Micrococcaceae bacterium]
MSPTQVPGLDFTAIDFETANGFRGSPCAVGLVRVRDGVVAETGSWLMRPPRGFDRFDPRNVRIHGITEDQVADRPRFGEVFAELQDFIGDDALVAHNAGFDLGVIESALEVSGAEVPELRFGCSLMLARKSYSLTSYALPSAAAEAGFTLQNHHDALADARACAAIVQDIGYRQSSYEAEASLHRAFSAVLESAGLSLRRLAAHAAGQDESRPTLQARGMADYFDATVSLPQDTRLPDLMRWPDEGINPQPNPDADPSHPLHGQLVVFTGNLGMPRQEAKHKVAQLGARTANRISAATTVLVVGDGFRPEHLEGSGSSRAGVSKAIGHRKMRDALDRRERGQQLSIVSESELLQMLDINWPVASEV